jgi:hypothetical protein
LPVVVELRSRVVDLSWRVVFEARSRRPLQ